MTNAKKIEKTKSAIAKTKAIIADHQAKLRDLEKLKTQLENDEVVAMFRREKLNEDEFAALLRSQRKDDNAEDVAPQDQDIAQNSLESSSMGKEDEDSDPI